MIRSLALSTFLAVAPACLAQTATDAVPPTDAISAKPQLLAAAVPFSLSSSRDADLPDAPEPAAPAHGDQAKPTEGTATRNVAPRYASTIQPNEAAQPLHGSEYLVYGLRDTFNLYSVAGMTISAGWSQLIDSQPHYGRDAEAFGKREGAAALRATIQTMTYDAVFSPMFHDDPRYYAMGDSQGFFKRALYAASRVVVTRSANSAQSRFNAPLLLAYGVTAASNNAYYPDQDRGARTTFEGWGTSLAGAAAGFEVDEFLDDALRLVHLKK